MGLIKSALLLGGGIYAVKKITKSQEKKYEMQKNNNQQDMYMYGGGDPGQNQQYYQPQPQYQQKQQRPGQGYNHSGTRDGYYISQDYGHGQSRGQSQYKYANDDQNDFLPPYIPQDEKRRMK